ncbi:MAG: Gfo/Idh/MocA family oxidoreductase [SAR324 cluster bacterium]|nr:Gfo/Idh/MocA family oxidoreductase [SAR324 cluster bacterium]
MKTRFSASDLIGLQKVWPMPSEKRPIDIIAAGGIVRDAHLPAYQKGGFPVSGIYDPNIQRAEALAEQYGIPSVYSSLDQAVSQGNVIDLATPPDAHYDILSKVPEGSTVLIQKPMGRNWQDAKRIRSLCNKKRLNAAINFQLRFSPMMLPIRDALQRGVFGTLHELEVRLACQTPWQLWPFLEELEHVEVLVHSIHYLDWIRSVLGEPTGAYCCAVPHPQFPRLNDARNSIILAYELPIRCCLSLNHTFVQGPQHQSATIRIEGSRGAAVVTMGLLLNYPHGEPETVEIVTEGTDWTPIPIEGRWFPDAFIGVMANLQRYAAGEDEQLVTSVNEAIGTMAVVEACITAHQSGGIPIPKL